MKISSPNTTQVPNIIFDYWMSRLTPAEFKVLLCIVRKTFGWHKERDYISLKQIKEITGLSHFGIAKNIDSLLDKKLILKIKSKTSDGDDAPNQYEIDVLDESDSCNSVGGGSQLSLLGVVNSVDNGVVNSVDTQNKDNTKENITKRSTLEVSQPPPEATAFVSYLFDRLKKGNADHKKPNLDKWAIEIDRTIRIDKRSYEDARKVVDWAFAQSDEFWPIAIQSPQTLRKLFDRALIKMRYKSKGRQQATHQEERTKRCDENRKWASFINRITFSKEGQFMKLEEFAVSMRMGIQWELIGYSEKSFKEVILTKLKNWGISHQMLEIEI